MPKLTKKAICLGRTYVRTDRPTLIIQVFFNRTKILLNLTHLTLTEVNNLYLNFFIGLGHFVQEKKVWRFSTNYAQKTGFSKVPIFGRFLDHDQFKECAKMRTFLKIKLRGLC